MIVHFSVLLCFTHFYVRVLSFTLNNCRRDKGRNKESGKKNRRKIKKERNQGGCCMNFKQAEMVNCSRNQIPKIRLPIGCDKLGMCVAEF